VNSSPPKGGIKKVHLLTFFYLFVFRPRKKNDLFLWNVKMNILDLLEQDGIGLKKVASTNGGEYAGPSPKSGGNDRLRVWPNQGIDGTWWDRSADGVNGKGGDCIEYLRYFREMSFQDACSFLGREPVPSSKLVKKENKPAWEPKQNTSPDEIWIKKSNVLVNWCHEQLFIDTGKEALEYLKTERGLSEKTIKFFRLGWNPKDAWPLRKVWGLPNGLSKDNKPITKIYLPKGVIIPCFVDGLLQKVKIRLQEPKENYPNYAGFYSIRKSVI